MVVPQRQRVQKVHRRRLHCRLPRPFFLFFTPVVFYTSLQGLSLIQPSTPIASADLRDQRDHLQTDNNEPATAISKKELLFLNYTSSDWEKTWVDKIQDLEKSNEEICQLLGTQSNLTRRFLHATCTHFSEEWCQIDDTYRSMWFHLRTGELRVGRNRLPVDQKRIKFGPEQVVRVVAQDDEDLFSRFYFQLPNGKIHVEYIEPLVGVLRHPLACCESTYRYNASVMGGNDGSNSKCKVNALYTSRGHYLAPNRTLASRRRAFYFDAGASHWNKGKGGPSLSYFHHVWKRQGLPLDAIYAFEARTKNETFFESIPVQYRHIFHYQQTYVRSNAEDGSGPFLPHEIQKLATKEDYVLFKLDIDSPGVEEGNIEHLLSDQSDSLDYIDEFFYEFHSDELQKWYAMFLKLRQQGVRAHSWV